MNKYVLIILIVIGCGTYYDESEILTNAELYLALKKTDIHILEKNYKKIMYKGQIYWAKNN
tara:strand:- start:474 stop:656 length:183 start_codon:yes stop_codon:yes gene_type:complete